MPKMDEDAAMIFIIFFNPMIQLFDLWLIEKTEHFFLQLTAAFSWDDLNQTDPFFDGFLDDAIKFSINFVSPVINFMQVKF